MTARYAIYFAPPADHPLWAAGCTWLGRDPESGAEAGGGAHRATPRRYGFHATLTPPFVLRDGLTPVRLAALMAQFANQRRAFAMPTLAVATLEDFIALRPVWPPRSDAGNALRSLADDCVRGFDNFRRPLSPADARRRHAVALGDRQRAHIERWGYAYVFDCWRFHTTLSDALPDTGEGPRLRAALVAEATNHFADALAPPLRCEDIALFFEPTPGAEFQLVRRFAFPS